MGFLDEFLDNIVGQAKNLQTRLEEITSPQEPRETQQQSLLALEQFIQNYYHSNSLTNQQAYTKLQNGVVEITMFGQHSSNGLLITENGYILTAKHCVQDITNKKYLGLGIQMSNQLSPFPYAIQEIWSDKKFDIAIIKAGIPGEIKPCQYKFLPPGELKKNLPIGTMSCWNNKIKLHGGTIIDESIEITEIEGDHFSNHFIIDGPPTIKGDSGGIVLTPSGKLAGFISTGTDERYTSAVNLQNALELISYYIHYKRSQT